MIRREFSWREWFKISFPLQMVALMFGVGIWVFVNRGREVDVKKVVKIEYTKLPAGLAFERAPTVETSIGLSGPLYRLRTIQDEEMTILMDLSAARAGLNRMEISVDSLKLPLDLQVSGPYPRTALVFLEPVLSREIPIRPVLEGQTKEGSTVMGVKLSAELVTVVGPRSVLMKMDYVPFPISIEGKSASFSVSGRPELVASGLSSDDLISADVEISAVRTSKEFLNVPITVSGSREISVSPAVARVVVEGPETQAASFKWDPQVLVDVEGLGKGRYRLRGRVVLPEGWRASAIEPQNFLVEIIK
jgi:YbbR domain-containing protein